MKPPVPFPLSLQIGTDIVHLPRITRLLTKPSYLTRFTRRILSDSEQRDFQTRFNLRPDYSRFSGLRETVEKKGSGADDSNTNANPNPRALVRVTPDMARWLAGRFAAKEAGRKAARGGAKAVSWRDVVVRVPAFERVEREDGKGDQNQIDGEGEGENESAEGRPEVILYDKDERGRIGRLSISHDGEYVVATVLAAG